MPLDLHPAPEHLLIGTVLGTVTGSGIALLHFITERLAGKIGPVGHLVEHVGDFIVGVSFPLVPLLTFFVLMVVFGFPLTYSLGGSYMISFFVSAICVDLWLDRLSYRLYRVTSTELSEDEARSIKCTVESRLYTIRDRVGDITRTDVNRLADRLSNDTWYVDSLLSQSQRYETPTVSTETSDGRRLLLKILLLGLIVCSIVALYLGV
ncbi:hypothetical protein [Methanopyrus kandleri]